MIFDENVVVFDTSNQYIAAALYRGKQEVQSIIEFMPRGQAERLMSLLNELLEGASLDWPDISKIGVCKFITCSRASCCICFGIN